MMNTETSPAKPENSPQFVPFGSPLPPGLEEYLRTINPWWVGKRIPPPIPPLVV
jgi:hypothetical protein